MFVIKLLELLLNLCDLALQFFDIFFHRLQCIIVVIDKLGYLLIHSL